MECYDFESERWLVMTEKPGHVFGSAMCSVKGRLYTLGGVQSKQVDQYITLHYSTVQYSTGGPVRPRDGLLAALLPQPATLPGGSRRGGPGGLHIRGRGLSQGILRLEVVFQCL